MRVVLDGDAHHPVLVRAAQEALTNAARHAGGQVVRVSAGPTRLVVTNSVVDGPATAPAAAPARGLRWLGERVEAAGGRLRAGRDDRTWQLAVDLPQA